MAHLKFVAMVKLEFKNIETMARINDAVFAATQQVFAEIEATAIENAPVLEKATSDRDPGELRDSIRDSIRHVVNRHAQGVKAKLFTATDVEWMSKGKPQKGYGGFVELGTAKTPAHPFLWPAFQKHIGELSEAVRAKLNDSSIGADHDSGVTLPRPAGSEEI